METINATRTESVSAPTVAAWWRWWAIAALAHIIGNPAGDGWTQSGVVNAIVGLVALAAIIRPDHRAIRIALPVGILASAWAEAPFLGNHWWLAAAVSAAALLSRPWAHDDDWWRRFAPTARVVLLVFYSFAAFAKLNTGFLDPAASCARYFANRTLDFWQLPEIAGDSSIAGLLPFATLLVELSVPLLLVLRRTRKFGVFFAIAFHLVLTLDLRQHFFDFTLVLIPLFVLFSPWFVLRDLDRRLPRPRALSVVWIGLVGLQVLAMQLPIGIVLRVLAVLASWGMWLGLALIILRVLAGVRKDARWPDRDGVTLSIRSPVLLALIGVVVLNGLSPYLELKTATGFNMYANLTTGGGETNHLLVPGTAELRPGQSDLATILTTDDEDLALYVDSGFDLPMANLRDYLAEHPEVAVSFETSGERFDLDPASEHPEFMNRQSTLVEKLLFLRAVPTVDPPACQPDWLPAR